MVSNTHSHPPLQGNRARCRKLTSHNLTLITCAIFENRVLYQTFQFFPANRKKRQQTTTKIAKKASKAKMRTLFSDIVRSDSCTFRQYLFYLGM